MLLWYILEGNCQMCVAHAPEQKMNFSNFFRVNWHLHINSVDLHQLTVGRCLAFAKWYLALCHRQISHKCFTNVLLALKNSARAATPTYLLTYRVSHIETYLLNWLTDRNAHWRVPLHPHQWQVTGITFLILEPLHRFWFFCD